MRLESWLRLSAVLLLSVSYSTLLQAEWYKQSRDIMGTRVAVELWSSDSAKAAICIEQVFDEMHRIDDKMSPYKPASVVSQINHLETGQSLPLDSELYRLLQRAQEFSKLTDGVFDISFASVGYQYDYRRHIQPDDASIQRNLKRIDYRKIKLQDGAISFTMDGMKIDLGGIAKGYAVDRSIGILHRCGISKALVSAGGDSRIMGDRNGQPWWIGIRHPRKQDAVALRIPLSDSALSTSGDYERFFIHNGSRVHHIIDPKTGHSAAGSWSATLIGDDATTTDALSTSVFILGAQKGLQLVNSLPAIDAIIIDSDGIVHYSSGLQEPTPDNRTSP